jgi:hypothetical protein
MVRPRSALHAALPCNDPLRSRPSRLIGEANHHHGRPSFRRGLWQAKTALSPRLSPRDRRPAAAALPQMPDARDELSETERWAHRRGDRRLTGRREGQGRSRRTRPGGIRPYRARPRRSKWDGLIGPRRSLNGRLGKCKPWNGQSYGRRRPRSAWMDSKSAREHRARIESHGLRPSSAITVAGERIAGAIERRTTVQVPPTSRLDFPTRSYIISPRRASLASRSVSL